MKQICSLVILLPIIFFSSCNEITGDDPVVTEQELVPDTLVQVIDVHNAVSSLDWAGTHKGVMPCADCEGVETELTLHKDLTYTLTTRHLGKAGKSFNYTGSFLWDVTGNIITLDGLSNQPNRYFVGENYLKQLDVNGQIVTGDFAEKYNLAKQTNGVASVGSNVRDRLLETYWRLVELNGQPVAKAAAGEREIHIILKAKNNRIQGFAGCNTMMGSYELKEGNLISIKKIASTRMACDDMKTELAFLAVLEQLDNFAISGNRLSFNKADMATLVSFEAVKGR